MSLVPYSDKPSNGYGEVPPTSTSGRVPTGHATEVIISNAAFREQQRLFHKKQQLSTRKRKRETKGDASVVHGASAFKGPWAKFEEYRPDANSGSEGTDEEVEIVYEEDELEEQPSAPTDKQGTSYLETGDGNETTEFHGSEEHDYQGRTYMHIPQDLDIDLLKDYPLEDRKNYHPKKLIHVWKSHTKPITQTRFFPDSGHLLLSASADSKVKLWDVYHARELLRTFSGHSKSVSDIDFTPSGAHFLSASYDRQMKLWDTETGACLSRFSTGATPHVIRFNPVSPNEFLAGMSDKKIVQFDVREASSSSPSTTNNATAATTTKPTQEYDHHLGPINTLTFCDSSRRFISTSDDKSLRAWEYGIPVPIKFIAEPHMFALTRSSLHPAGKYAAFQSSDNQILVYGAGDKFRQNRKKSFRGHNNAGYAVDVAISPDGGMVASGDSAGFACFWDWKTGRMWHKFMAEGKVEAPGGRGGGQNAACTVVQWHPREGSRVVTAGLTGELRYWD